jgi:hypothetical protein
MVNHVASSVTAVNQRILIARAYNMQAILIKYLPETNSFGIRLKAIARVGTLIEARNHSMDYDTQARALAVRFAKEMYVDGGFEIYGFGCLPNGDYVATLGA